MWPTTDIGGRRGELFLAAAVGCLDSQSQQSSSVVADQSANHSNVLRHIRWQHFCPILIISSV